MRAKLILIKFYARSYLAVPVTKFKKAKRGERIVQTRRELDSLRRRKKRPPRAKPVTLGAWRSSDFMGIDVEARPRLSVSC